jgi:hypothetical protein
MKYLLLLLLPAVSFGQQKKKTDKEYSVQAVVMNWVPFKSDIITREFYIEYLERCQPVSGVPMYEVKRHFHAFTCKDTVMIDPTGLDSLIKGANYIKIAGKVFKKEDKQ